MRSFGGDIFLSHVVDLFVAMLKQPIVSMGETLSLLELPNSTTASGSKSPLFVFGNTPRSNLKPTPDAMNTPKMSVTLNREGKRNVSAHAVSEENKYVESGSSNKYNINSTDRNNDDNETNKFRGGKRRKILMLMDSNRQFLDSSRLWDNLHIEPCGNTPDLVKILQRIDVSQYDVIIVHVGVNDIDKHSSASVAERLAEITQQIADAAPQSKILLSEVTPRQFNRDNEVRECNEILPNLLDSEVTLIRHSNLRNQ